METMLVIVMALLGTVIGSFLNVGIDRLSSGRSLVYPPSHCDICQHRFLPKDLMPVVSYLWYKGKLRVLT